MRVGIPALALGSPPRALGRSPSPMSMPPVPKKEEKQGPPPKKKGQKKSPPPGDILQLSIQCFTPSVKGPQAMRRRAVESRTFQSPGLQSLCIASGLGLGAPQHGYRAARRMARSEAGAVEKLLSSFQVPSSPQRPLQNIHQPQHAKSQDERPGPARRKRQSSTINC